MKGNDKRAEASRKARRKSLDDLRVFGSTCGSTSQTIDVEAKLAAKSRSTYTHNTNTHTHTLLNTDARAKTTDDRS